MKDGTPLAGRLRPWKKFHKIVHRPALTLDRIAQFMAVLHEYKDKRGWGRCPICDSPHLDEINALQQAKAPGYSKVLTQRFGLNPGTIWLHFNGHPQQKSKEYAERPLSTYALEFLILTGPRKSQTLEVEWEEINFGKRLQICPGVRESTGRQGHKMGKKMGDHVIVLSYAAIDVLRELERLQIKNGTKGKYVFPKMGDSSKHMGRGTINAFIKRYLSDDFPDITVHGMRTCYKSWSLDKGYADIDSKLTLAHSLGGMSNIYGRDASRIEERRTMMNDWAAYCGRPSGPRIPPLNQTEEVTDEQDRSARIA